MYEMAEDIITEVDMRKRGQITIPANIRSSLNLQEGQTFILIVNGRELILIPKVTNPMDNFGLLGKESDDFDFKQKLLDYKSG